MAYEDKFGITNIKPDRCGNLDISRDTGFTDDEHLAVFLFTPNMNKEHHYHIDLSVEQAEVLADWLTKFVKEHKK